MNRADDGVGKGLGVCNALHYCGGAAPCVAAGIDTLQIGLEGGESNGIHLDAIGGEELALHLFTYGGYHSIAGNLQTLPCGNGLPAAPFVRLAQLHFLTRQDTVPLLYGSRQLQERNAIRQGQLQFLHIGGHILPGAPVDQGRGFGPGPQSGPGGVHGCVAAAHHGHMAQGHGLSGL